MVKSTKKSFLIRILPRTDKDRTSLKMSLSSVRSFLMISPKYLKLAKYSNGTPFKQIFGEDCHSTLLEEITTHTVVDTLYMIRCSGAKF